MHISLGLILLGLVTPPESQDVATEDAHLVPGVTLRVYRIAQRPQRIRHLAPDQTPNLDELRPLVDYHGDAGFGNIDAPHLTTVSGFLQVATAGSYVFRLTSDDGSQLWIDSQRVIDNDGNHGPLAVDSEPLALEPGLVSLEIIHFDGGGGRDLMLEWQPPGHGDRPFELVPTESLRTIKDLTRVTAPGVKRLKGDRPPGDGAPLESAHPGWHIDTIRPEDWKPMVGALCFDARDRLIVGTYFPLQRDERVLPDIDSKQPDTLVALSGVTLSENPQADPSRIKMEKVADGLYEPAGLCAVGDSLYVSHRRAITRLRDLDDDGYFETHEDVGWGWEGWNYHQFCFGLVHWDPDESGAHPGYLYAALSTAMAPPAWDGMTSNAAPNGPMRGSFIEVDLSSHDTRVIAGGSRTPNGLGLGPSHGGRPALLYADNQGTWMPTNQLSEVVPGRFLGHYNHTTLVPKLADRFPDGGHASVFCERPRMPATLLLEHNTLCNSPTECRLIESGPYAGQLLIGELTAGGVRRAMLERINGQWQGGVVRWTQGLEVGVNRMTWGPDDALYIGGIGGGGNWNWRNTRFGLQRLRPTGRSVFEIHHVKATPEGFRIRFTKPVGSSWLEDPANYTVSQWTYRPTVEYGGPKIDEQVLSVSDAQPLDHPTSTDVHLHVPGLETPRCVHIRCPAVASDGETIWSPEAWYTLNHIPREIETASLNGQDITPRVRADGVGLGVLPPADAVALVSNSSRPVWSTPGVTRSGNLGQRTQDDLLAAQPWIEAGEGSGDLVTTTLFGDCRLHIEWFSPPGGSGQLAGNSGVYLHDIYELQVLGTLAGDEPLQANEAGALYGYKPADVNASNGPGHWQAYDIWFRAPRFAEGVKVEDARLTAYWNGQLIHNDVALPRGTGSRGNTPEPGPSSETLTWTPALAQQVGPLRLQDHASDAEGPVRYRNIWIQSLEPIPATPGDWIDLFGDGNLDRWRPIGGNAAYRLDQTPEGRVVVGTTASSTPNTFLVFEKPLGDFELLVEVRQHPELNSGIQIRSLIEGGLPNRSGRLRGLQVEMDPSPRAYTAGIYDEARRGWIHPLSDAPYARRAYRPGEWNTIRIVAAGPTVRTWVNGIPAAQIHDAMTLEGFIGLQVHGVGDRVDPLEVSWRRLRIRRLE